MDGGHETLDHGELAVDDLGERSQAVGCARGVGDDWDVGLVLLVVDAHDEHWCIGGWGRDDDLLCASLDVGRCLVGGGEDTGGLDNVLDAGLAPRNGSWVLLHVELNLLAVDDEALRAINLDLAIEDSVGRVVLQHVCLWSVLVRHSKLFATLPSPRG